MEGATPTPFAVRHVISWNVAGVSAKGFEAFLDCITIGRPWDILLLQEAVWSRSSRPYSYATDRGHWVYSMAPQRGQRSCAIVVHADISQYVIEGSFNELGRSCAIDIVLDNRLVRFVCAHLWAKGGIGKYVQSLSDVEYLLCKLPKNSELMIGADVQSKLGFYDANIFPSCVGPYSEGPRGDKGRHAFSFFIEKLNLTALNTITLQHNGSFTHWDRHNFEDENVKHFEPRQIDFVFASQGLASCSRAVVGDSWATESDHRPVDASITYPLTAVQQKIKNVNNIRKHRNRRKPVNWILTDPLYNSSIMDTLGIESKGDVSDMFISDVDLQLSFHTFTDGSHLESGRAGWAFAVFAVGDSTGDGPIVMDGSGPVITSQKANFYVGAERKSSSVAEMNAVIECLLWWAAIAEAVTNSNEETIGKIKMSAPAHIFPPGIRLFLRLIRCWSYD